MHLITYRIVLIVFKGKFTARVGTAVHEHVRCVRSVAVMSANVYVYINIREVSELEVNIQRISSTPRSHVHYIPMYTGHTLRKLLILALSSSILVA